MLVGDYLFNPAWNPNLKQHVAIIGRIDRGARAELFLVGGAALAVAYDATRATRDLDAVFIPTDVIRKAYPGRPIPAKVKFLLTEIVDSMQR